MGRENWTAYDRAVRNAVPVLVVAWAKDRGEEGLDGGGGWSDVRLMCIGANQTVAGSRNLTMVEKANGAKRSGGGGGLGMVTALVVSVVLSLAL